MRAWLVVALLAIPLAAGAVVQRQEADVTLASQAGPATLAAGDIGNPTIGASGTSASVALGSLPALVANDILTLVSSNDAWQVHAELVSESGWGVLESITVSLADGVLTEPQIVISLGSLTQSAGDSVNLPEITTDTELRVIGSGTGSMSLDLVLTPDGKTSPELRYRVDLSVT